MRSSLNLNLHDWMLRVLEAPGCSQLHSSESIVGQVFMSFREASKAFGPPTAVVAPKEIRIRIGNRGIVRRSGRLDVRRGPRKNLGKWEPLRVAMSWPVGLGKLGSIDRGLGLLIVSYAESSVLRMRVRTLASST